MDNDTSALRVKMSNEFVALENDSIPLPYHVKMIFEVVYKKYDEIGQPLQKQFRN